MFFWAVTSFEYEISCFLAAEFVFDDEGWMKRMMCEERTVERGMMKDAGD
jgi:hypothetical protein